MTRYKELAREGTDYAKRFFEYREMCSQAARAIASAYKSFLQAPDGSTSFLEITPSLDFTTKKKPLTDLPTLQLGDDGFFYFAINLNLTCGQAYAMQQNSLLGISATKDRVLVRWHEQTFDVARDDLPALETLFECISSASLSHYKSEVALSKKVLGFTPESSA